MAEKYYSILTNRGKELEAQSSATGKPVIIKDFVVGDGNGKVVTPDPARTSLVKEVYRGAISALQISPDQTNQFIAQLALVTDVGGFVVREVGLLTDTGELYSVANCAAIEKPENSVSVSLQYRLAVSETANIELKAATGDGLFLRQDANLGDVNDAAESRKNIGLKGAAVLDVGNTADTVAAGDDPRIVNAVPNTRKINNKRLNGDITLTATDVNALGTTTVRAQLNPGEGNVADANLLPPNAVSFVYNNAKNSPPFTGPLLDFSGLGNGYNAQIVAAYNGAGERIGFRTRNGDSKAWNPWYEIYHTGNKPTTTDINAIQDGTISSSASPPAWNAKSGMYNLSMTGSSQMIFHLNANYGSCPAAQFKFDYKNRGAWYRSARDKVGFEEDWSELLTHKGSLNITGPLRSSGEYQSTKADNFRIAYGGYGVFWRNDGNRLYLMLTNKDDIYGGYNSLRPFYVDIATGNVALQHNVSVGGPLSCNSTITPGNYSNFDARYYTKGQTDAAYMAKTGAYTKVESDTRYQLKNTASLGDNGWHRDASTGLITQWMRVNRVGQYLTSFNFPMAFPSKCLAITFGEINTDNRSSQVNIWVYQYSRSGATIRMEEGEQATFIIAKGY